MSMKSNKSDNDASPSVGEEKKTEEEVKEIQEEDFEEAFLARIDKNPFVVRGMASSKEAWREAKVYQADKPLSKMTYLEYCEHVCACITQGDFALLNNQLVNMMNNAIANQPMLACKITALFDDVSVAARELIYFCECFPEHAKRYQEAYANALVTEGGIYFLGLCCHGNLQDPFGYLSKAAELGHPYGKYYYAKSMLYRPHADVSQALNYLLEARAQGCTAAVTFLGKIITRKYLSEEEMKALPSGEALLHDAIAQGDAAAAWQLGTILKFKQKRYHLANECFRIAVDENDAYAHVDLAQNYLAGLGCQKDIVRAISLYEKGYGLGQGEEVIRIIQFEYYQYQDILEKSDSAHELLGYLWEHLMAGREITPCTRKLFGTYCRAEIKRRLLDEKDGVRDLVLLRHLIDPEHPLAPMLCKQERRFVFWRHPNLVSELEKRLASQKANERIALVIVITATKTDLNTLFEPALMFLMLQFIQGEDIPIKRYYFGEPTRRLKIEVMDEKEEKDKAAESQEEAGNSGARLPVKKR